MDTFDPTTDSIEKWRSLAEASMKGRSIESLARHDHEGGLIKALYTAADRPETLPTLGQTGWTIAQELEPTDSAATLNLAIMDELAGGVGRIDLPAGIDASLPGQSLDGVFLDAIDLGFAPGGDINDAIHAITPIMGKLRGVSLGFDPGLALLEGGDAASGTNAVTDFLKAADTPHDARGFAVAGDDYHLLGLGSATELATMLAATVHILRTMEEAGIAPDAGWSRIEWRVTGDADLYGTIARTRALVVLLQRVAEAVSASPEGIEARVHGITSARHLTSLDAETNILRNGTGLLGLALGGAGVITCRPHDWLTGSSAEALRLARNAHHLMAEEARIAHVADPAAGSYFIEAMTRDLAEQAWARFQDIEKTGGIAAASGMIHDWANAAHEARLRSINEGRENLLGVTIHPVMQPRPGPVLDGARGPRGGSRRPAAGWESLREAASKRPLRCLLLDIRDEGRAGECQRWFQVIGAEAAAMRVASMAEAEATITSAKPDVVVLGGCDDVPLLATAAGEACRVLEDTAFAGDKFAVMSDLVKGSA